MVSRKQSHQEGLSHSWKKWDWYSTVLLTHSLNLYYVLLCTSIKLFTWLCTEHAQKLSVEIVNYHCCLHLYKVLRFVMWRKRIWHILVAFWPCLYYSYSASQAYVSERHNARCFRTVSSVLLDSMQPCGRGIVTLPLPSTRPTIQSARAVPQRAMESQSVSTSLGRATVHRVIPLICSLRLLELPQVTTPSVHTHTVYIQLIQL